MQSVLEAVLSYIESGGFVMPPLVVATLLLWFMIGFRMLTLQRGTGRPVRQLLDDVRAGRRRRARGIIDRAAIQGVAIVERHPEHRARVLDEAFFPYYEDLKKGRILILGIVAISPLLGLLGTVTGMIETFESLGDMTLFAQSGGIAGGIAQALFTTQLGLSVAIPGVIVGRLLDRRQRRCEEELDQIKALLGGAS